MMMNNFLKLVQFLTILSSLSLTQDVNVMKKYQQPYEDNYSYISIDLVKRPTSSNKSELRE